MGKEVVIVGGKRTLFCEWSGGKRGDGEKGGLLSEISAEELGTEVIKGAIEHTSTDPNSVDHVVMGCIADLRFKLFLGPDMQVLGAGILKRHLC